MSANDRQDMFRVHVVAVEKIIGCLDQEFHSFKDFTMRYFSSKMTPQWREFLREEEVVNVAEQGLPERLVQSLILQEKMQLGLWSQRLRILLCFEFWHIFPSW